MIITKAGSISLGVGESDQPEGGKTSGDLASQSQSDISAEDLNAIECCNTNRGTKREYMFLLTPLY